MTTKRHKERKSNVLPAAVSSPSPLGGVRVGVRGGLSALARAMQLPDRSAAFRPQKPRATHDFNSKPAATSDRTVWFGSCGVRNTNPTPAYSRFCGLKAALRLHRLSVVVGLSLSFCAAAFAADAPVARIGTNPVPAAALRVAVARTSLPLNDPATVRKALDELVKFEALAAEAKRLGYDRDPEVEDQTKRLMVQKLIADKVDKVVDRTPPTDADLRSYYDRHQAEFTTAALARGQVATLLIKGKKEETLNFAKEAMELARKAKFEDVVKRYSDFANERLGGGDTGWLVADAPNKRYPDEVLKALLALGKPGELAQPVVTDKAVFLVRLVEKRPAQVSSFDQVKPGLRLAVERERRQRAYDALCDKLKKDLGVKVDEAAVQKVAEENRQSSRPPPAPFRTP